MSKIKATEKSPGIDAFLTQITGKNRPETVASNNCMTCPGPADEFRDPLSRKEYTISGMCQKCQGEVFGGEEP